MKCTNCGCELPDGARFCASCGAQQPEEFALVAQQMGQKYSIHCGSPNDADSVYCTTCGRNVNGDDEYEYEPVRRTPKKLITGIVGVLVIAVVVVGTVKIIGGMGGSKADSYIAYVKDGYINQGDIDHYKKKTVEYEGRYADENAESEDHSAGVSYSKDGKYICYPTDLNFGNFTSFRLNMQKVGKTDEPVKIDSEVRVYTILDNNKVIYIKGDNDTLYINDWKGNKEKIASGVSNYRLDDDQKNIVWGESNGETRIDICQQDLALKKEKKTLIKEVYPYFETSSDLKYVVGRNDDTVYMVENFGEKQKIASGVKNTFYNDLDNGGIYYTKDLEETLSAEEAIDDDCADSDATLEKPDREDYQVEKIQKNSWTGKYEKVQTLDEEAYDEAKEKYYAKEKRDEIREELEEHEISVPIEKLYYVKDGKETQIDDKVAQIHNNSWEGIIYNHYNMEEMPKLKLSEIEDIDSVDSDYYQLLLESVQTYMYTEKNKSVVLDEVLYSTWGVDSDSKTGYGLKKDDEDLDDEDSTYTLYSFSVDSKSDGTCKLVSENVDSHRKLIEDGNIYYLKDTDGNGNGDLFCNEKNIDSDVRTICKIPDSSNILYEVDYSESNGSSTLKMYDGKKDTTIADDVYSYLPVDEKHIGLLTDYNVRYHRGDLKYYLGKEELKNIDEDVSFIFGGK